MPSPHLTACMRKFLVILNAMLHNKTHWQTPAPTFLNLFPFLPSWARFLNTVAAKCPESEYVYKISQLNRGFWSAVLVQMKGFG